MTPDEKAQVLALFDEAHRWCQDSEARDGAGNPVTYNDENAVSWDLVGGICHLFGWKRGSQLAGQIHRHITKGVAARFAPCSEAASITALLDFNDDAAMSFDQFVSTLRAVPVWRGGAQVPEADESAAHAERDRHPDAHDHRSLAARHDR